MASVGRHISIQTRIASGQRDVLHAATAARNFNSAQQNSKLHTCAALPPDSFTLDVGKVLGYVMT